MRWLSTNAIFLCPFLGILGSSSPWIAQGDPYAKTSMLPSGKQCSLLCDAGLGAQVRKWSSPISIMIKTRWRWWRWWWWWWWWWWGASPSLHHPGHASAVGFRHLSSHWPHPGLWRGFLSFIQMDAGSGWTPNILFVKLRGFTGKFPF